MCGENTCVDHGNNKTFENYADPCLRTADNAMSHSKSPIENASLSCFERVRVRGTTKVGYELGVSLSTYSDWKNLINIFQKKSQF